MAKGPADRPIPPRQQSPYHQDVSADSPRMDSGEPVQQRKPGQPFPDGETLQTPENNPTLREQMLKKTAPPTYQVMAPYSDLQLMVAMSQVIDFYESYQKDQGMSEFEVKCNVELAVDWMNKKVKL